ncbi:MAG: sigma-54 dependent transcriptional regulator [Planctomycetota bacterium]
MSAARILLVEDEAPFRELLTRQLEKRGFEVDAVGSGEQALALEGGGWDVALCDISLPGMSGIELVRLLQTRSPTTQAIVLTGQGSVTTAIEAMKLGAYHYFEKPVKFSELELYLQGALEKKRLAEENRVLKDQLARRDRPAQLVGDSEPMREVRQLIARVGPNDAAVLVEGETGTGKDLVARAIHACSPRRERAFVAINCGALSEALLENELFGHAAGAYTGAGKEQRGLFEVAHGGTLFIDEVAEMSLETQKKFLRVLENGEYRRLGETRLRVADVRVIAATNRRLREQVRDGAFREDLYYRLAVLSIQTPPLREHKQDLPLLVEELLSRARAAGARDVRVSREAMDAFLAYDWPGNVRELRNVLERALVLTPGDTIRPKDCRGLDEAPTSRLPTASGPQERPSGPASSGTLAEVEREHIQRVLAETEGNKTQAAKRLGVSLRSLYRKLDKLGLKDEP